MKIKKFRIKNYKSINDTGYCYTASDITIIAGKNESGKTAILEALHDFNKEIKTIPDSAKQLYGNKKPSIEVCFEVDKNNLNNILKAAGISKNNVIINYILEEGITLCKSSDGKYDIDRSTFNILKKYRHYEKIERKNIDILRKDILEIKRYYPFKKLEIPNFKKNIKELRTALVYFQVEIRKHGSNVNPKNPNKYRILRLIRDINSNINQMLKKDDYTTDKYLKAILDYIPNIIYFNSFESILPYEIPFSEALVNEAVLDFAKVSGLNMDELLDKVDTQRRKNYLSSHAAEISGDFMDYWKQDKIELIADQNGLNLILGITTVRLSFFKSVITAIKATGCKRK